MSTVMSSIEASLPSGDSQFPVTVGRRSWEWLLALRRRLNVDLEIVDARQRPLLGAPPTATSTTLQELLATGPAGVRLALSTVLRGGAKQALSVESLHLVCVPLTVGRSVEGALIVAQQRADNVSAERARGALDLMAFWLSNAVEAHLSSPSLEEGDLDRLSSLCRLLDESAAHKSDRDIVTAFGEALAIWHDLEVYGFAETARGEFVREVALAGVDLARSPAAIQRTSLPEGGQITRISRLDVERLGFSNDQDLVMTRLAGQASAWVIVVCGTVAAGDLPRLGRYLELLEQSIGRASTTSTTRVIAAMAKHLLDDGRPAEGQARRALDEVRDALGWSFVAFSVSAPGGPSLVRVGAMPATVEADDSSEGRRLRIVRSLPQQYSMVMVAEWAHARGVTRQEHQVAEAAADMLESWSRRLVRQSKDLTDRRAARRTYDQDLEQLASRAIEGGEPVTAVVLSFSDSASRPGVIQTRIGRLRERVRPTDMVGVLGMGEIGMLLHNTPGAEARVVTARLKQALQEGEGPDSSLEVMAGFATREPGQLHGGPLAEQARADALRSAEEPQR